jgi:hypothetical protein
LSTTESIHLLQTGLPVKAQSQVRQQDTARQSRISRRREGLDDLLFHAIELVLRQRSYR